jgi:hypothetical protein
MNTPTQTDKLQTLYAQFCLELNWRSRPLDTLAKRFREIIAGPRKVYRWFDLTGYVRRLVRVFPSVGNPQLQSYGPAAQAEQSEAKTAV